MPFRSDRVRLSHQLTDTEHTRPVVGALKDITRAVNDHDRTIPSLLDEIEALRSAQLSIDQVRDALASTGSAPLTVTSIAGSSAGTGAVRSGTHATRVGLSGSGLDNVLFWETDRRLLYLYREPSGWAYVAGIYRTVFVGTLDDEPVADSSDGGDTQAGVTAATVDGHPAGAYDGSANRAGLIIGGVALEYPLLVAATVNQATRDARQAELLSRIVWHLLADGYTAGKQRNPSGIVSGDKIAVVEDGVLRAFDIFTSPSYASVITVQALQVSPANLVADAGTAD